MRGPRKHFVPTKRFFSGNKLAWEKSQQEVCANSFIKKDIHSRRRQKTGARHLNGDTVASDSILQRRGRTTCFHQQDEKSIVITVCAVVPENHFKSEMMVAELFEKQDAFFRFVMSTNNVTIDDEGYSTVFRCLGLEVKRSEECHCLASIDIYDEALFHNASFILGIVCGISLGFIIWLCLRLLCQRQEKEERKATTRMSLRAEEVSYLAETHRLTPVAASWLYRGERLQDGGQFSLALQYFEMVLLADSFCLPAHENILLTSEAIADQKVTPASYENIQMTDEAIADRKKEADVRKQELVYSYLNHPIQNGLNPC